MSENHALDQLRQTWTQPEKDTAFPSRTELHAQLRAFHQEEGPRSQVAAMIIMAVFGLLFAALWGSRYGSPEPLPHFGLLALIAWTAAAWRGLLAYQQRQLLRVPARSQRAYLRQLRGQLRLHRWGQRLLAGLLLTSGAIFFWQTPLPEDTRSQIAAGAFLLVSLFLMGVVLWWYRHHHPYRLPEMEREIGELLAEYEAESPEV
ncbi:MAG: hypothetical protein D6722_15845 [Bacteroidetes bacterium]|nr:MAG: hypothetical protein D6722_15845 [Bacteroidota bacterium]